MPIRAHLCMRLLPNASVPGKTVYTIFLGTIWVFENGRFRKLETRNLGENAIFRFSSIPVVFSLSVDRK